MPSSTSAASDSQSRRSRLKHWLVIGAIVVVAAVVLIYFRAPAQAFLKRAVDWIHTLGSWAPIAFILIYAFASVCFVPGSVLTLSAGVIFGLVAGSAYVSVAATLGATLSFLIGRHLARDWVSRRLADNQVFQALDRATAREGWKIVGLCRLSPLFPFALVNYGFGLTRVSLPHYVVATWLCMIPWTVVYVYVGSLATASTSSNGPWTIILRIAGLAVTAVVTVIIARMARRALSERIAATEEPDRTF